MTAKAKCKKCNHIIETEGEEVFCNCGEISIGKNGDPMRCSALDFKNFIRVDEQGNEIEITVQEKKKLTKAEVKQTIDSMIEDIENLPPNAKITAVTQFDMLGVLYVLSALSDCEE